MRYEDLKNTIFDVEVSGFKNCFDTESKPVNLAIWLTSNKYETKQNQIRAITDKKERDKIKIQLPTITPSALLKSRDNKLSDKDKLISHSGFMQLDIDFKDNVHLSDYNKLLDTLPNIQNIAYCGQSVSGLGYFCLVPIAYPDKLNYHFQKFNELMLTFFNIKLDTSKGSNITDLRIYSYTQNAYFNPNAKPFSLLHRPTIKTINKTAYKSNISHFNNDKFKTVLDRHNEKNSFVEGNQNNYLKALSSYCSVKGIDINETIIGCYQFENEEYSKKRINQIVTSVYNKCKNDFNSKPFADLKSNTQTLETKHKSNTIKKFNPLCLEPQRYKYLKKIDLNIVLFEKKQSANNVESAKGYNNTFYLTPQQIQNIWSEEQPTTNKDLIF
jgi:hypothetical protein